MAYDFEVRTGVCRKYEADFEIATLVLLLRQRRQGKELDAFLFQGLEGEELLRRARAFFGLP